MKKIIGLIILFVSIQSFCQSEIIFVNPGLKVGYTFGANGGFTFGYEVSIVAINLSNESRYGIVYDYDTFGVNSKHHIGIEYMYQAGGIDIGPTFFSNNDFSKIGFSIIPSGGALILPYYNFTYIDQQTMFHEVGSYGKIFIGDLSWFKI